ncbi:hypothetical protein AU468_08890 [Alkalispirochaeta sphaeroplastigenens]|uniref:AMP-activated protein kinase glycogen-binding domain-containing protein n=1 Tax=Alkalispirochaeta sphaeroplastigenens TaxID=1187066 RepID=A0A2S4JN69_9SPIO|nr:glycogen-binding domain-containing protein [Alkalispirochaeta sphaeroplastigenens]POR00977.1 hypothetical protein AU468_08890 [Alkalispirochaeta sphaeroplastigenens]
MKALSFVLVLLFSLGSAPFFRDLPPWSTALAGEQRLLSIDSFLRVAGITEAGPPRVLDDFVVFTYEQREYARHVAIAFAHENFERKHTFTARARPGRSDLFYLAVPYSRGQDMLEYRLIVDGVWLADPHAPRRRSDSRGVTLGQVDLPEQPLYREESPRFHPDGTVTFRFSFDHRISPTLQTVTQRQISVSAFHEPRITLTGSFSGWDPFRHPLRQDPENPAFYSVRLPLPPGEHYYYFMVDGERVLDPFHRNYARDRQHGTLVSTVRVPPPSHRNSLRHGTQAR